MANKYEQTPYFNLQSDGRAIFTHSTEAIKNMAKILVQADEQDADLENSFDKNIENFLNAYRSQEQVKQIVHTIQDTIQKMQLPFSSFEKYYNIDIGNTSSRDFQEDSAILKFLYAKREKENLYVEFETDRVKRDSYFNVSFMSYETIPVKFTSIARSLPSHEIIKLTPKNEALPVYEISIVFVYSNVGMYIFYGVRQLIYKGWNEYVTGDKKKYVYLQMKYSEFEDEKWKEYIQKNLSDSAEFIEKSLSEFVTLT